MVRPTCGGIRHACGLAAQCDLSGRAPPEAALLGQSSPPPVAILELSLYTRHADPVTRYETAGASPDTAQLAAYMQAPTSHDKIHPGKATTPSVTTSIGRPSNVHLQDRQFSMPERCPSTRAASAEGLPCPSIGKSYPSRPRRSPAIPSPRDARLGLRALWRRGSRPPRRYSSAPTSSPAPNPHSPARSEERFKAGHPQ
jgi:hypothetical protein